MNEVRTETQSMGREEWESISRRLQAPFEPGDVDFRVQGRANEQTGRAQVVAYVDARVVQDRLDSVVGPGNWSFDWTPLVIENGEVMITKGTLTIYGVSKSDAGTASNFEQSLGAVSHCFKRAAVHWGIGRYLYNLPMNWVPAEKGGRIADQVVRELRSKLPRPASSQDAQVDTQTKDTNKRSGRQARPESGTQATPSSTPATVSSVPSAVAETMATEQQLRSIAKLCEALGKPQPEPGLTLVQARELISQLSGEYQRMRRAS
jgi:hypothetical protein